MKRVLDFVFGLSILIVLSPILLVFCLLIYLQDYHNPFYVAERVGRGERRFKMYKLRSMVVNADRSGVDSTASDDQRITAVGQMVRRYKLDELAQLINVVMGDMSLVGPRPNVARETDLYTSEEKRLLSMRPGITDLSSIIFSDEGDILEGSDDPDLDYNQLIRPGKGYLGLVYVDHHNLFLDVKIIFLTVLAIVNKSAAIKSVVSILQKLSVPDDIIAIAKRDQPLVPMPPPGAKKIVTDRDSVPA